MTDITICLTLIMSSAQIVIITDNSPSQDYTHLSNQTTLSHVIPRFRPFTVLHVMSIKFRGEFLTKSLKFEGRGLSWKLLLVHLLLFITTYH